MAKVKFYQGSSKEYDSTKYVDGIYFATDTQILYLNGESYSGVSIDTINTLISEVEQEIPTKTSLLTNDSGFVTSNNLGKNITIFDLHTLGTSTISDLQLCNMFGVSEKSEILEILSEIATDSSIITIINKEAGDWTEENGYGYFGAEAVAFFAGNNSFGNREKPDTIYFITSDPSNRTQLYLIEIMYTDTEEITFSFNRLNLIDIPTIEELSEEEIKLLWDTD